MKFYNIVVIHTMHISKKWISSGTENRSETCYFATQIVSNDFTCFLCRLKSVFLICALCVSLLYYRISLFRFRWTLKKILMLMRTPGTLFVMILEISNKNQNHMVKPHVFQRIFIFFIMRFNSFFLIFAFRVSLQYYRRMF